MAETTPEPEQRLKEELLEAKRDHVRAEAEKAKAEARKATAEARRADKETERLGNEVREAVVRAELSEMGLERERTKREKELAADEYHFTYTFNGVVSDQSVKQCIAQLAIWVRTVPECPIEIIFNSPGGEIISGMTLFDYIQVLRRKGHEITTVSLGMAASMAGILLQAGSMRIMGREAWLLIHEASFGSSGKIGEIEDTVKWVNAIQKRILHIFASRSHMTERQIATKWKRTDWWISSDDALRLGFVDAILTDDPALPDAATPKATKKSKGCLS